MRKKKLVRPEDVVVKKKIEYTENIFDSDLLFLINMAVDEVVDHIADNFSDEFCDGYTGALYSSSGLGQGSLFMLEGYSTAVIYLEHFSPCPEHISTLVHEINHYCFNTLRLKGIPHTKDTDELFAYYTQDVVREFLVNYFKN